MTVPEPVPVVDDAATRLLADLRTEIARADSKAAVLVSALGMTVTAFGALLAGSNWSPAELITMAAAAWWVGAASLISALFALLMAVLPRHITSRWTPGHPLTYFGDIRRAVALGVLPAALAATDADPQAGRIHALAETSRIATQKHRWIRAGLIAFVVSVVLLPGAAVLG
ncbi:Pycsar system effector family protein [Streptomyces sp. NPDC057137]|uniref:Pycsar system effector family protein n=1 Tax=Streptomyces sp. NPDC057137 TaxID=3346030 RepID=UPI00362DEA35